MQFNEYLGYDGAADKKLKELGNELVSQLQKLFPDDETWKLFGNPTGVIKAAVGFLPIGDGLGNVSDADIKAAIPRVTGMSQLVKALLDARDSQAGRKS